MKKTLYSFLLAYLFTTGIFAQAGTIDSTFSTDGTIYLNEDFFALDMIELDDQTAITISIPDDDTSLTLVSKINLDGHLITDFGQNGSVMIDDPSKIIGYNIERYGQDKFLVYGGNFEDIGPKVGLRRFYNNGVVDSTFGNNGYASFESTNSLDYSFGLKVLPDGKVLFSYALWDEEALVLMRLNEDGSVDSSFGNFGISQISYGDDYTNFFSPSIEVQDNRIVLMGSIYDSGENNGVAVLRLMMDGSVDTTFGIDGWVRHPIDKWETDGYDFCRLAPNGEMYISGTLLDTTFGEISSLATVKLNPDGSLNTSFGDDGISYIQLPEYDLETFSNLIQPDGKIVITGTLDYDVEFLCRINPDGTLDQTFGYGGFSYSELLPWKESWGMQVKLISDNSLWCLGYMVDPDTDVSFASVTKYKSGLIIGINQVANRPIPMSVFPNPAKEAIDIRFDLDKGGEVEMNLSTLAGNNILNLGKSVYGAGANTRKVNLPSNIAAGNYLLTLRTASQVSSYLLNVR